MLYLRTIIVYIIYIYKAKISWPKIELEKKVYTKTAPGKKKQKDVTKVHE